MTFCRYLAFFALICSSQIAVGAVSDPLSLVGGASGNFALGWNGEGWKNGHWCGDTLARDLSPDTVTTVPDTIKDFFVSTPISDTVIITRQSYSIDTLMITTTYIQTQTIIRDSLNDPIVDIINGYTTIYDSSIVISCSQNDFITDTGGFTEGTFYFNYYYKFRNYWAQLPFVWTNWQGYDSLTVSPYKYLLIRYKGLLPVHQAKLSFFYGTWGPNADTMKTFLKLGDGVGVLVASPTEWKTEIIQIPDSVSLPGITGITLSIENVPNGGGDSTSDVGNLKIDQISLLVNPEGPVKHTVSPRMNQSDRFHFIPRTTGKVTLFVYSLRGELLSSRTIGVEANRQYTVREFALRNSGLSSQQIRMVKITGQGMNVNEKIW
jgi:hypothetical protein